MLILSAFAFVVILTADLLIPPSPRELLRGMTPRLRELRAAADSCRDALANERSRLEASDARFDSLRQRIDLYEDLDPRGVPADSYEVYLEVFNEYNEGIPARAAAGDTLEAHWKSCRGIVEDHNALADSVRTIAEDADLLRDTRREPAGEGP
jgi:hypothetical protein